MDDSEQSPGWKFAEYEMKGVPLRLEIGPKDMEKEQCVIARRDNGEKTFVALSDLESAVPALLYQDHMVRRSGLRDGHEGESRHDQPLHSLCPGAFGRRLPGLRQAGRKDGLLGRSVLKNAKKFPDRFGRGIFHDSDAAARGGSQAGEKGGSIPAKREG